MKGLSEHAGCRRGDFFGRVGLIQEVRFSSSASGCSRSSRVDGECLSSLTPMGLLERATSYKDKISNGISAESTACVAYPFSMGG